MRSLRKGGVLALVLSLLALTACQSSPPDLPAGAAAAVLGDSAVKRQVAALPHRSVSPPPTMRLAPGLIPPTNRWYSGLVFGAKPQPVFPLPLSFGLTASGFAFGLPDVTATPKTIAGGYTPQVQLDAGAAGATVTAYDDVSVTLEYHTASGGRIGHTTIAEGSPLVGFTADSAVTLASSVAFTPASGSPAEPDPRARESRRTPVCGARPGGRASQAGRPHPADARAERRALPGAGGVDGLARRPVGQRASPLRVDGILDRTRHCHDIAGLSSGRRQHGLRLALPASRRSPSEPKCDARPLRQHLRNDAGVLRRTP